MTRFIAGLIVGLLLSSASALGPECFIRMKDNAVVRNVETNAKIITDANVVGVFLEGNDFVSVNWCTLDSVNDGVGIARCWYEAPKDK